MCGARVAVAWSSNSIAAPSWPVSVKVQLALVQLVEQRKRAADALFIPVRLTYSTAQEQREFTVVLDQKGRVDHL